MNQVIYEIIPCFVSNYQSVKLLALIVSCAITALPLLVYNLQCSLINHIPIRSDYLKHSSYCPFNALRTLHFLMTYLVEHWSLLIYV